MLEPPDAAVSQRQEMLRGDKTTLGIRGSAIGTC
jgi:hypothetical protein